MRRVTDELITVILVLALLAIGLPAIGYVMTAATDHDTISRSR